VTLEYRGLAAEVEERVGRIESEALRKAVNG
jgi:hypothetical protein